MSWGRAADLAPSCDIEGGEAIDDCIIGAGVIGAGVIGAICGGAIGAIGGGAIIAGGGAGRD